jgi:hypothetical protein
MAPVSFRGHVIWLTEAQGGRTTDQAPPGPDYRVTGYVPPHTADNGLASFWIRDFEPGKWASTATAFWAIADNEGPREVRPGIVVVVTEGRRVVAYFHVDEVERDPANEQPG